MRIRLAAAVFLAISAMAAAAAGEPLKVCLDEDLPPLSLHRRGKPDSGFDVTLAQAVAARLGRPLKIQWFESKLDEDSSPALEANALLSDGRCALVGSYALTRDSLVVPGVSNAWGVPDCSPASSAASSASSGDCCESLPRDSKPVAGSLSICLVSNAEARR